MFDSPIFSVAIGLALVYLILSLIVTSITQVIADALGLKATQLKKSITNLLGETADKLKDGQAPELLEGFYDSPFVAHFRKPGKSGKGSDPGKIDSASFLPAMEDAIEKKFNIDNVTEILGWASSIKIKAYDVEEAVEGLNNSEEAREFLGTDLGKTLVSKFTRARREVDAIATSITDPVVRFEQHVEDWYDDATDKARTWYRAHLRRISFLIAAIVVLLFNADTLRIAGSIWNSDDKGALISAMAEKFVADTPTAPAAADGTGTGDLKVSVKQLEDQVKQFSQVIEDGDLPIGWQEQSKEAFYDNEGKVSFACILKVFLGWTVTAFALSLGAPFWYDMLKKTIQVRSTVKKTQQEFMGRPAS